MPRAGYAGDFVGHKIMVGRMVHNLMKLCFLQEKVYAPYHKWFGTGFKQLACADELLPHLEAALLAPDWQSSEKHLVPAYEAVARQHNALNLTPEIDPTVRNFHGRPFMVIDGMRFADRLLACVSNDPALLHLWSKTNIGSVDQFSANTNLLSHQVHFWPLRHFYDDIANQSDQRETHY